MIERTQPPLSARDADDGVVRTMQQAAALFGTGNWRGAEKLCRRILAVDPQFFHALSLLGIIAAQSGREPEALQLLKRAVSARPQDASAHNNLGNLLRECGQPHAALECFERALRLKPQYAQARNNQGNALRALGRLPEALASYDQAITLDPQLVDAHSNRGVALQELQRFDEALASYERALRLDPASAEAYNNRGNALRDLRRFDEALASFGRALSIRPGFADVHVNRGCVLYDLHRPDEAVAEYDRALALQPRSARARHNKAFALLLAGDFVRGWAEHEWRLATPDRSGVHQRAFKSVRWTGQEPLAGKTILLYSEQGYGDAIQFCRYASLVAARGARVILEVPRRLIRLVEGLEGVSAAIAEGEPLPVCDHHAALMSMPFAFGTTLASIPASIPYLHVDPAPVRLWRGRLGDSPRLRVGLAWSGGFRPAQPELWPLNSRRNVALEKLAVLKHPRIDYYSLQKGEDAQAQLRQLTARGWNGPDLIDWTGELQDFADTAALLSNLDLVISVDTAIAHLAGALGKPVWIMNRYDTCWRWLLQRHDSPWYPTVTLYRQDAPGDWDGVVERIRTDLFRRADERAMD